MQAADALSRTYDILPEVDENSPFDHSSPTLPTVPNQATICGLFDGPVSPYEPSLRANSENPQKSALLTPKVSPPLSSSGSEMRLWSKTHGTFWLSRTALHRTAQSARVRRQPVPPPSIGRLDIEAPSTPISTKKDPRGGVHKSPEGSNRRRSARLVARVSPAQSLQTPPPASEKKLWSETYGTFWLSRTAAHRSAQRSNCQGQLTRPSPRPLSDPEVPAAPTPLRGLEQSHPQSAKPTPGGRKQGAGRPNDPPPPSGPLSSTTARTPLKCLWINGNLRAPSTTHAAGLSTKPKPLSTPAPIKSALRSQKPVTDAPAEQVKRTVTFDTQLRTPLSGAFKTSRIPVPRNGQPPLGKPRP
ncbi:hypothetical protein AAHC03_024267 [Spirometra sp. Aus1]